MRQDAHSEPLAVDFRGAIPEKVKQYATEKLSRLERYAPRPILHTKVEIHEEGNPAIAERFAAKASLDVNGNVLHASVSGTTFEEVIDLLTDRLRRQMERLFATHLRETPARFYVGVRLDRARELLRQTGMGILAVGVACGFASPSSFSRTYRVRFGQSPKDERTR